MPKMKSKRCLRRRVKVTGRGKIMLTKSGRRHLLTVKSRKRKRNKRRNSQVPSQFLSRFRTMLAPR